MRYQNVTVFIVTLALAAITLTGTAYTSEFPQAAQAEAAGFDALAHDLFDGALLACADDEPQLAEASAQ
jgi:hypothetical protein